MDCNRIPVSKPGSRRNPTKRVSRPRNLAQELCLRVSPPRNLAQETCSGRSRRESTTRHWCGLERRGLRDARCSIGARSLYPASTRAGQSPHLLIRAQEPARRLGLQFSSSKCSLGSHCFFRTFARLDSSGRSWDWCRVSFDCQIVV